MATANVTDDTFDQEVLQASTPVVVDFWAEWCQPCKSIGPALEELSDELSGQVKIAKVNVDENQQVPEKYAIRAMPTLLVIKDGEVIAQQVGALTKSKLSDWIKQSIA